MSNENIHLNVSEYTSDELLEILGLEDIELNMEKKYKYGDLYVNAKQLITYIAREKSLKYKDNDSYSLKLQNFFLDVGIELMKKIDELDEATNIIGETEDFGLDASKFLNPVDRPELETSSKMVQSVTTKIFPIDSMFRFTQPEVSTYDMSGIACTGRNIPVQVNHACDFSFHLSEPQRNVLSIKPISVHIPITWYNIDEKYGTNRFLIWKVDANMEEPSSPPTDCSQIDISSGLYDALDLCEKINKQLIVTGLDISLNYNKNSMKIDISNPGPSGIRIEFYNIPIKAPCHKIKRNYNLGTILGFNTTNIMIPAYSILNATNVINLIHTKSLNIVLDDFNTSNTCNPDTISMYYPNNKYESSGRPSFASSALLDISNGDCGVNVSEPSDSCSSNKPVNKDTLSHLTKSQRYHLAQNKNVLKYNTVNEYYLPHTTKDHLCTITVPTIDFDNINSFKVITKFNQTVTNSRIYRKPVNIRKMRVKLLNQFGEVMDLNGCPWMVTLSLDVLSVN